MYMDDPEAWDPAFLQNDAMDLRLWRAAEADTVGTAKAMCEPGKHYVETGSPPYHGFAVSEDAPSGMSVYPDDESVEMDGIPVLWGDLTGQFERNHADVELSSGDVNGWGIDMTWSNSKPDAKSEAITSALARAGWSWDSSEGAWVKA